MNKRLLLSVLTVLFAAGMTACAVLLKEPEILFPEAAALCAGAWRLLGRTEPAPDAL